MLSNREHVIDTAERNRLNQLMIFEKEARKKGFKQIAGVDEAGRGPLAGPVVAAACIIPEKLYIPGVNDSKKLSEKMRQELFEHLTTHKRIVYGVGIVAPEEIDRINIYQATIVAMLQAVANLSEVPDCLLVDGLQLPHPTLPVQKIIGGDASSFCIAAASIIAKVTRDRLMCAYHEHWPHYGFVKHKGYGTAMHLEALEKHGPCVVHRRSFEPLKSRLQFSL